jgi:hypothetical protein
MNATTPTIAISAATLFATVSAAAPASAATPNASIRATSANIRCDPPDTPEQTRSDTLLVKQQQGGLLGTQENCPAVQPIVLSALGTAWAHYIPSNGVDVPIFWKKSSWTLIDKGARQVSGYNRWADWVLLRSEATGARVIRVNTHWAAGAWGPKATPEKQAAWDAGARNTQSLVAGLQAAHPRAAVIVTGDLNQGSTTPDPTTGAANPNAAAPLGTALAGRAVRYDVGPGSTGNEFSSDTEWVMHLQSRHLSRTTTSTIPCTAQPEDPSEGGRFRCQGVPDTPGTLYTDHASVSRSYTLR